MLKYKSNYLPPVTKQNIGIIFLILASIKLILIYAYGPIVFADTQGYLSFADEILKSDSWIHNSSSVSTYRMLGYPLLIAAAKLISPLHYGYVLITAQTFASIIAAYLLFRLCLAMTNSFLLSILVPIGYLSANITWDLAILTDGFYNSLFSILACGLALKALNNNSDNLKTTALFALLAAMSILLRESAIYFCLFLTLILIIGFFYQHDKPLRKLVSLLVFILPFLATYSGYQMWNEHRTGQKFLTTGMSTALMQPLVKIGGYGAQPFQTDDCFDQVARKTIRRHEWDEVFTLNEVLKKQCHYNDLTLAQTAQSKFLHSLVQYPIAYLKYALPNIPKIAILTWNPIEFFWRNTAMYADIPKQTPNNKIKEFTKTLAPQDLIGGLFGIFSRIFSLALFAAFSLGVPINLATSIAARQPLTRTRAIQLGLWLNCFAMMGMYWLVHWEHRYTVGLSGIILTLGLFEARKLGSKVTIDLLMQKLFSNSSRKQKKCPN